jgi:hypothetical protein
MALIPFPDVLDMMARDPGWTQELGSAVLASRPAVMDAVQRMRQRAYDYGYLRTNPYEQVVVAGTTGRTTSIRMLRGLNTTGLAYARESGTSGMMSIRRIAANIATATEGKESNKWVMDV